MVAMAQSAANWRNTHAHAPVLQPPSLQQYKATRTSSNNTYICSCTSAQDLFMSLLIFFHFWKSLIWEKLRKSISDNEDAEEKGKEKTGEINAIYNCRIRVFFGLLVCLDGVLMFSLFFPFFSIFILFACPFSLLLIWAIYFSAFCGSSIDI